MVWCGDGVPVESHSQRTAEQCLEGAARADAALEALNALEGMVHDLEVGREAGAKFWRYFDGIERVLQRIAERDRYYAGELARVLERERQSR